jgi:hypothetical protein
MNVCINNAKYPASLERHKIYRVVPDKDAARNSDVRVMCAGDDVSRDYLSGDVSKSQYLSGGSSKPRPSL